VAEELFVDDGDDDNPALAYVVSCFVLWYPFRQNQLTTDGYSAIS